jgi:hypothetical protein
MGVIGDRTRESERRIATGVAGQRDAALQSLFERRFGSEQASGDG